LGRAALERKRNRIRGTRRGVVGEKVKYPLPNRLSIVNSYAVDLKIVLIDLIWFHQNEGGAQAGFAPLGSLDRSGNQPGTCAS
jgi:hypothetical protein